MVPFLTNVMNNQSAVQLALIVANHPGMFPGGVPQPVFKYTCDTSAGPVPCPPAGENGNPLAIRDLGVGLLVVSPPTGMDTPQPENLAINSPGRSGASAQ